MKHRILLAALVAFAVLAPAASACETVYWVKQGENEAYFNYGQTVQVKAGGQAILRIYYAGRGDSIQTTTSSIGHPWDYNLKGYDRRETSRVVATRPQNDQEYSRGKIVLKPNNPGTTMLGYRIDGVGKGTSQIPNHCFVDTVTIQVVQRGR